MWTAFLKVNSCSLCFAGNCSVALRACVTVTIAQHDLSYYRLEQDMASSTIPNQRLIYL